MEPFYKDTMKSIKTEDLKIHISEPATVRLVGLTHAHLRELETSGTRCPRWPRWQKWAGARPAGSVGRAGNS